MVDVKTLLYNMGKNSSIWVYQSQPVHTCIKTKSVNNVERRVNMP